ncbi:hypothetical protein LXL04_005706 [Taraxacum kok-saghyz]
MQRRYFHVRVVFHAAFFPFLSGATVRTLVVLCRNSLPETIHQRHHRRVNAKQFIRFVDLENSFFRYCRLIEFNLRELLFKEGLNPKVMGVEVASGCSNWLQSSNYWPPSSSRQTLASAISSPSTRRWGLTNVALVFRCVHRPAIFGTKLNRSLSFESKGRKSIKEVVTASLNAEFSGEEEFCREIQELALLFQLSDDDENNTRNTDDILESENQNPEPFTSSKLQQPDWAGDMIPASIERKANSVELPFSLRIILEKETMAGRIKRSREICLLLSEEGLLFNGIHNSVFAMSSNVAFAATAPPITLESSSIIENQIQTKIDPSSIKTFSVNSSGKTTSIGGINGGGGNFRPVAGGTDGEESFDGAVAHHRKIIPDGVSSSLTISPSISNQTTHEEESSVWKSIVEEADNMQELIINGVLDRQTMQNFVSLVTAKVVEEEADGSLFRTELLYQMGLSEEPDNPLLLDNYAQFLYIVAQDYDRAEEYFKRASKVEPNDAEALSKYSNFLWEIRKDLWGAEQNLLEAIAIDPVNSFYTATYASFLWNTTSGDDDSFIPLDSPPTLIKINHGKSGITAETIHPC